MQWELLVAISSSSLWLLVDPMAELVPHWDRGCLVTPMGGRESRPQLSFGTQYLHIFCSPPSDLGDAEPQSIKRTKQRVEGEGSILQLSPLWSPNTRIRRRRQIQIQMQKNLSHLVNHFLEGKSRSRGKGGRKLRRTTNEICGSGLQCFPAYWMSSFPLPLGADIFSEFLADLWFPISR